MAADVLAMQVGRASVAMVLAYFFPGIFLSQHQGPVSISDKTSYHKISQSLETACPVAALKFDNCCRGPCQISKRCEDLNYQSRGFETSRDLTIRRFIRYWDSAQEGSLTGWKQGIQIIIHLFCFLRNYFDAIHLTASTFWFTSYISYFNDEQRHAISKTGIGFLFNLSYLASMLRLLKFSLWTLTAQATHRNSGQRFYVANIHVFSCCITMYD